MYDYQLSVSVSDQLWNSAVSHATVNESADAFFEEHGAAPMLDDTRRRYRRVRARGRAILIRGNERYGVLTNDLSPLGIGFFSPIPLLPKEVVTLYFDESDRKVLRICRCYRTEEQGFSCGGNYQDGPQSPGAYRNFLAELRS